ncbi:portal protein [Mycobacterium phage Godines]|uniref:Portal protein n=1 Tax=Mycobacterium phage Godines TaxID=1675551 RepID=A0A0K1LRK9_9CAUD|nr:portal protein [Mycobacterium phage Godines]AKU45211.1 portal protein [Mycobacterium phage Godines]
MAPTSLRIVRRPKSEPVSTRQRALVAASQPVENPGKAFRKAMGSSTRTDWQDDAWKAYDAVGELRYYVGWRSSSASRVRLIASAIDPDTGLPTGSIDEDDRVGARVQQIVNQIAGGALGQAQLIKRVVEQLTVAGETWVAILFTDKSRLDSNGNPVPEWLALTPEEVRASEKKTIIELPTGDKHEFRDGLDGMFRVWNPRARRAREPDSPVRANLDSLKEIVRTTKTIANASKSRLIGNGVVFVPHEMSLPSMNAPVASNKPGAPAPPILGTPAVQQLQELLFQVAQTAYDDEDSMAALIPMFAAAPGELIKNVTHLKFDNQVTEVAIKTRNDAIARLAMGLDVSPERLLGLGSNSNHWSAWQIGDEDVRLHILPPVEMLCEAITNQVLRTVLMREGIDPNAYVVWHDASQLTVDPDKTDEARDAFDRGAITAEAMVKMLGLADDTVYDFTTPEGWAQWARDRVGQDPNLLPTLAVLIPELAEVEFPTPTVALPPAEEQDEDEEASGASRREEPDTENDAGTDDSEQASLDSRETAMVEALVFRALELAGKRRRTRSLPYELRQLSDRELVRRLEPVRREHVADLIRGWDSMLEERAVQALNMNIPGIRAAVKRAVYGELTKTIDGEVS